MPLEPKLTLNDPEPNAQRVTTVAQPWRANHKAARFVVQERF